ncbi:hypothetical protein HBH56_017210 [Parastagonospora nodorum]|nr:hypothetical protein HBH56_017210 [Parastagonospora nodorum]KAH3937331.1 hypothetical protein HBH54_017260 [Parastagonospora nodorum]KAH3953481.1 hypothetical protein HBH53_029630 [Parastagonospora nodorum]KAH3990248.1 hypothetical protein HBH52_006620 [Parastagonospora nodorum]KAH4006884.1 hypothetical protein HBI10_017050 [Parastagonospora nodorum]
MRAENLFATQNTALAPVDALSAPTQHCGKTGKHLDFWLEACRDQTDELMGRVTSVSEGCVTSVWFAISDICGAIHTI